MRPAALANNLDEIATRLKGAQDIGRLA